MFRRKDKQKKDCPSRRLEDRTGPIETVIAFGTKITGTLSGRGSLHIGGYLQGRVTSEGLVWIGREGKIDGTVSADGLIVEGEIKGNIESQNKTELRSGGRVIGDISCAKISVAEDSFFQGEIKMPHQQDKPHTFVNKRKDADQSP